MMESDIAEERNRISLLDSTIKQIQLDSRYARRKGIQPEYS
jgi:hypothetical protein